MPAYNFQKQFEEPIRLHNKLTTIRARRKHGNAIPGQPLQLYTGMRTPLCTKIIPDPLCVSVRPIIIDVESGILQIVMENRRLLRAEVERLVLRDGLKTSSAFADFFIQYYELPANLYLIEWRP